MENMRTFPPKVYTDENSYGYLLRMPKGWPGPRLVEPTPENIRECKRAEAERMRKRTPKWANKKAIREIYRLCREISKQTGIPHHVDHIVPLSGPCRSIRGELEQSNSWPCVCGLHVENNLRIITAAANLAKAIRHDG